MFRDIISLRPVAWAGVALVTWAVACVIKRALLARRIAQTGGVRAPLISSNPISASIWIAVAGVAQLNDKLLELFDGIFPKYGTAESPNCVEISLDIPSIRFILTREPEHIKTVLTTKFSDFGKGYQFHRVWSPFLGDSIFTTDGEKWHNSRALIRPMFIKEKVRDIEIFDRWTNVLIDMLPTHGETVDIANLFYRMTLDVTTDFLLGTSVNSLGNPKNDFARAFNEVQRMQMMLTITAPLGPIMPKSTYLKGIKEIEQFMMPYIEQTLRLAPEQLEKLEKSDKNFTFLHNIARFSRDPKVIRDQIMAVLLAGRDTTAATLSWCIYELARRPDVWTRLRNDVLQTVGPFGKQPTYEDLKSLTLLTHTLNETLRLYPAVPYNIRAAVEDTSLPSPDGQSPPICVLKGDIIVYSALSMQRRRDIYPPVTDEFADPAIFEPERWTKWTPKPWTFLPFNGGPRICVGQNFAMTEMAYCMVLLLQKYERIEYRGDWAAQYHKAEIVGAPGHGVPVALFAARDVPAKE